MIYLPEEEFRELKGKIKEAMVEAVVQAIETNVGVRINLAPRLTVRRGDGAVCLDEISLASLHEADVWPRYSEEAYD